MRPAGDEVIRAARVLVVFAVVGLVVVPLAVPGLAFLAWRSRGAQ